ncbi:MAG: PilZ domain-containing protein [Pseudomonadota bacterium]|nr:PilZ domain-containing protein [Pseudomonadota bacterium]
MDFHAGAFEAATEFEPAGSTAAERRSEPRRETVDECATLFFRGALYVVPVLNISSRGTMVESELQPRLGESVQIRFAGCSPIYAFVRWSRDGRLGLNFGCELTIG